MEKMVLPLLMYKEKGSIRKGTKKRGLVVPSWNHLYVIRKSRPILDEWAKAHKEKLQKEAISWVKNTGWKCTEGVKVIAKTSVFWNDNRKKDTHNLTKLIFDALEGIIYDNDYYVLVQFMDFQIDKKDPRIEIEFSVKTDE